MSKVDNNGFIAELDKNEIIIIGTNSKGEHAGGLALTAYKKGWYPYGKSEGLFNQGFGIDTMSGKEKIIEGLEHLQKTAKSLPLVTFLMTPIGTGIAGYSKAEVFDMIDEIKWTSNVILVGWLND